MEMTCKHDNPIPECLRCCRDSSIGTIYKECLPAVKFMVFSNSGTEDDAVDIFHDALLIMLKNSQKPGFSLTCSIKTYIYSISFNLWQKELKKRARQVDFHAYFDLPDDVDIDCKTDYEKINEIFWNNFHMLKPDSKKVLTMYLMKYPVKKITHEMGYASDNYTKFKKYLSKELLKKAIYNDPVYKELDCADSN